MSEWVSDNIVDYYLLETSVIIAILVSFSLLGLCVGWMLTLGSRRKAKQLKLERQDLLLKYRALKSIE